MKDIMQALETQQQAFLLYVYVYVYRKQSIYRYRKKDPLDRPGYLRGSCCSSFASESRGWNRSKSSVPLSLRRIHIPLPLDPHPHTLIKYHQARPAHFRNTRQKINICEREMGVSICIQWRPVRSWGLQCLPVFSRRLNIGKTVHLTKDPAHLASHIESWHCSCWDFCLDLCFTPWSMCWWMRVCVCFLLPEHNIFTYWVFHYPSSFFSLTAYFFLWEIML